MAEDENAHWCGVLDVVGGGTWPARWMMTARQLFENIACFGSCVGNISEVRTESTARDVEHERAVAGRTGRRINRRCGGLAHRTQHALCGLATHEKIHSSTRSRVPKTVVTRKVLGHGDELLVIPAVAVQLIDSKRMGEGIRAFRQALGGGDERHYEP